MDQEERRILPERCSASFGNCAVRRRHPAGRNPEDPMLAADLRMQDQVQVCAKANAESQPAQGRGRGRAQPCRRDGPRADHLHAWDHFFGIRFSAGAAYHLPVVSVDGRGLSALPNVPPQPAEREAGSTAVSSQSMQPPIPSVF